MILWLRELIYSDDIYSRYNKRYWRDNFFQLSNHNVCAIVVILLLSTLIIIGHFFSMIRCVLCKYSNDSSFEKCRDYLFNINKPIPENPIYPANHDKQ